jgi:predicted transcriptional regulator
VKKQTICFRLDSAKVKSLDTLAASLDQDRAGLLNEAVEAYLDVQEWQVRHIRESIRQADGGQFVGHDQVRKMVGKWHRPG